jgi:hypothetical protein
VGKGCADNSGLPEVESYFTIKNINILRYLLKKKYIDKSFLA